jgi:hypothetical protein
MQFSFLSIILLISTVGAAGFAVLLSMSLKKYQNANFDLQVKSKRISDEYEIKISELQTQLDSERKYLESLEKETSDMALDQSKLHESVGDSGALTQSQQTIENLNQKIVEQDENIEHLHNELSKNSNNANSTQAIATINHYKEDQQHFLNGLPDITAQTLANVENGKHLNTPLSSILQNTGMVENYDYMVEYADEARSQILYAIIVDHRSSNVVIIDGKLASFLEEHLNEESDDDATNNQIKELSLSRVEFLTKAEFKENIKATLLNLDSITQINDIHICLYIPSEMIEARLRKIAPEFITDIKSKGAIISSATGLVNIISNAIQSNLAMHNIAAFDDILLDIGHSEENAETDDGADSDNSTMEGDEETPTEESNATEADEAPAMAKQEEHLEPEPTAHIEEQEKTALDSEFDLEASIDEPQVSATETDEQPVAQNEETPAEQEPTTNLHETEEAALDNDPFASIEKPLETTAESPQMEETSIEPQHHKEEAHITEEHTLDNDPFANLSELKNTPPQETADSKENNTASGATSMDDFNVDEFLGSLNTATPPIDTQQPEAEPEPAEPTAAHEPEPVAEQNIPTTEEAPQPSAAAEQQNKPTEMDSGIEYSSDAENIDDFDIESFLNDAPTFKKQEANS